MAVRAVHLVLAVVGALVPAAASHACSTVLLGAPGHTRLAYSYDIVTGAGALLINGRRAERRSILMDEPDAWRVRHASVTFNQFGPGLPTTGMNEKGLVVTLMWNDGIEYPVPTDEPSVGELELIQRLLDTSATVDEAIAEARAVPVPGMVPIHYFITDRAGARAILAHREGALTALANDDIPVPALTNLDYDVLLAGLPRFVDAGDDRSVDRSDELDDLAGNSLGRFADAALAIDAAGPRPTTSAAFDALEEVANEITRWNIVYDPLERSATFRMGTTGTRHSLELDAVDLSCRTPPLGLSLDDAPVGRIEKALAPFGEAANLALIREVYPAFPPTNAVLPADAHARFATQTLGATHCVHGEGSVLLEEDR